MKRLPPSMEESERYMKFRIHSDTEFELGDVVDTLWSSCLSYLGSKGCGEASFWIIGNRFDQGKQQGVIRVKTESLDDLRAAVAMVDDVRSEDAFIEILEVSGTLKSLEAD